jgi:hypothetical protein
VHDGLCEPTPGELAIHDRERLLTESDFVEIVERRDNAPNKVKCLGCGIVFSGQAVRVRAHLLRIDGRGVRLCSRRPTTIHGHPVDTEKVLQPIETAFQEKKVEMLQRKTEAEDERALREANSKRRRTVAGDDPELRSMQTTLLTRSLPAKSTKEEVDQGASLALSYLTTSSPHHRTPPPQHGR